MKNDELEVFSSVMDNVFNNLKNPASQENQIKNAWTVTLSKIKVYGEGKQHFGEKLAQHSRIIELKNGILLVEADHPGWIQYLNTYKNFILNGLKMKIPQLKITNLAFRLKGNEFNLSPTFEEQIQKNREEMLKKLDDDQKILDNTANSAENNNSGDNLPDDLKNRLERLKQQMAEDEKTRVH
ncbi:MAG: DUF721 domain-containing protein [Treponema sp.]|nr:DUF721 domain-containing protein [Treponema sp.]